MTRAGWRGWPATIVRPPIASPRRPASRMPSCRCRARSIRSAVRHDLRRSDRIRRERDGPQVEEIGLRPTKESLALQTGEPARHRLDQNGDRTPTVGDLHSLTRSHPSQDGACLATQLPDPDSFHVRHGSTHAGGNSVAAPADGSPACGSKPEPLMAPGGTGCFVRLSDPSQMTLTQWRSCEQRGTRPSSRRSARASARRTRPPTSSRLLSHPGWGQAAETGRTPAGDPRRRYQPMIARQRRPGAVVDPLGPLSGPRYPTRASSSSRVSSTSGTSWSPKDSSSICCRSCATNPDCVADRYR